MSDAVTVPGKKLKAMQDRIAQLEAENERLRNAARNLVGNGTITNGGWLGVGAISYAPNHPYTKLFLALGGE